MKVLITGSRGYIGSNLAKTFVYNDIIPFGVDKELRPEGSAIYGLFHHTSFEDSDLADIICNFGIDTICHLAADASVPDSLVSPDKYYKNNVANTIQLLNNLVERKWKGNIIFSSSAAVYPSTSFPVSEDQETNPMNPYGHSKLMCEQILRDYHNAFGIGVVCFRYFNVAGAWGDTGDHEASDHVIQKLIRASFNGSNFVIFSDKKDTPDGTCVRDYFHVRDVCDAHLAAITFLKANPGFYIYNLGTSSGTSVAELIKEFELTTKADLNFIVGPPRPGDPDFLVANGSKFVQDVKYTYKHSDLKNILATAYEYGSIKQKEYHGV